MAAFFWKTVLTTCPVPGEPGKNATFYEYQKGQLLEEFRGVWTTKSLPESLTEADRLNGYQYKGVAFLGFSAVRFFSSGPTASWEPFRPGTVAMNVVTSKGAGYRDERKYDYRVGTQDVEPVRIFKLKGEWYFKVLHGTEFTPDSLSREFVKRACTQLTSANPLTQQ
jgi:hypothetical protein